MSDFGKKLLGLLTAWPFAYALLFIFFVLGMMFERPGRISDLFPLVIVVHLLTVMLALGLLVFYLIDVFRNDRVHKDQKALWAIVLFFGGAIAMPFYWYLNIWRDPPTEDRNYKNLPDAGSFENADRYEWETETGEPLPREPHSWR